MLTLWYVSYCLQKARPLLHGIKNRRGMRKVSSYQKKEDSVPITLKYQKPNAVLKEHWLYYFPPKKIAARNCKRELKYM